MMNNVVLMFSPSNERTPYEQKENCTVILTVQLASSRPRNQ